MSLQDTPRLIALLTDAGVPFVVIGGVAAIVHGAQTFTRDLDVLIRFDPETLGRLLPALAPFAPRFALDPAHRPIPTSVAELLSYKNLHVVTDLGRLDFLGSTPVGGFDTIVARAASLEIAGQPILVASLDDLIDIKAALGRPKDLLVAHELRAVRDLLQRSTDPGS